MLKKNAYDYRMTRCYRIARYDYRISLLFSYEIILKQLFASGSVSI